MTKFSEDDPEPPFIARDNFYHRYTLEYKARALKVRWKTPSFACVAKLMLRPAKTRLSGMYMSNTVQPRRHSPRQYHALLPAPIVPPCLPPELPARRKTQGKLVYRNTDDNPCQAAGNSTAKRSKAHKPSQESREKGTLGSAHGLILILILIQPCSALARLLARHRRKR